MIIRDLNALGHVVALLRLCADGGWDDAAHYVHDFTHTEAAATLAGMAVMFAGALEDLDVDVDDQLIRWGRFAAEQRP